jgi:hypothetical protein
MDQNQKRRFSRGRRPGVKLKDYKKNPNDRPNLGRFSITMPTGLADVVRSLKPILDLEYSKIFRRGIEEFIIENFEKGLISKETFGNYWDERAKNSDQDWSG